METNVAIHSLLVKIQTIDTNNLDFKSSGAFKPRNITCVEASNLLLFVGVTSGTVYVFSRSTGVFKYMIPFTGGKVCSIACSENERVVAIGSIRGQVSVYEIIDEASQSRATSLPFFRFILTLGEHRGNEITEMLWSPTGKYLFIGDTKGLVSKLDLIVGDHHSGGISTADCQIILKLKARILQIQLLFQFLAICTVSSVFLGDIENEDFARVQFDSQEIRATGLALTVSKSELSEKYAKVQLYVSEMTTGLLHRFSLEGKLLESRKITIDLGVQFPIKTFDPVRTTSTVDTTRDDMTIHPSVSLGKLLLTDEGSLLSISNNHIYLIDPDQMKLIYWNDEFHKIKSAKMQCNYIFLWSGSKVEVLSLTRALPYAVQLLQAESKVPFERWIKHCVGSFGWKYSEDQQSQNNQKVIQYFTSVFLYGGTCLNEGDIRESISLVVPFDLPEENTPDVNGHEEQVDPRLLGLRKLIEIFEDFETGFSKLDGYKSKSIGIPSTVINSVSNFCSELIPNWDEIPTNFESNTLAKLMTSIENYCNLPQISNLYENLEQLSIDNEIQILNEKILHFLDSSILESTYRNGAGVSAVTETHNGSTDEQNVTGSNSSVPSINIFSTFIRQEKVSSWFTEFGVSEGQVCQDASHADYLVLLVPFLNPENRVLLIKEFENRRHAFCTWILLSTFYNFDRIFSSYELQIRSLLSTTVSYHFVKTIVSSIYGDLVNNDRDNHDFDSDTLHNLITLVHFVVNAEDLAGGRMEGSLTKDEVVSLLISQFPLKHGSKGQIFPKVQSLCSHSEMLLKMFEKACLFSERDTKVCKCGIPLDCSRKADTFLTTIKEVVTTLRIREFIQGTKSGSKSGSSYPIQLAMKSKLFGSDLWKYHIQFLDEATLIDILVRTGWCNLLKDFPLSLKRIQNLIQSREFLIKNQICQNCGEELELPNNFGSFSLDCIGIIVFNILCDQSIDNFQTVLEQVATLNDAGKFSLKFYQSIAAIPRSGRRDMSCDVLH